MSYHHNKDKKNQLPSYDTQTSDVAKREAGYFEINFKKKFVVTTLSFNAPMNDLISALSINLYYNTDRRFRVLLH